MIKKLKKLPLIRTISDAKVIGLIYKLSFFFQKLILINEVEILFQRINQRKI